MANLTINQGIKFTAGDGTNVIGTGDPSGLNGIIKQSSETGFYIQSSVDYTLNFYDGSSWAAYQSIDVSDANYTGGFAFAWDDNTAAYIKTADASHVVYVFGRDGDLKVDSTPGDATQAADSIVDGSGSLSITSIEAQNDYTEGLSVASDGTVTFDRTDNNAAYQLKFSGSGITIGKNGDDTVTFTGADEFTTPLTTDGDLFVQAGGSDSRLAIGTDGQYLSVASGAPAWADLTSLSIGSAQQIPYMNAGATDLSYDAKLSFTDGNNASLNVDRYGYGDAIKLGDTHPTNAANYCNITNYGKIAGKYYAVESEITPSNNNFGIKTKSNHPMYLLTNNTVNNVSMFTNGNVSISTVTDLSASLGVQGDGNTSATSVVKFNNASNQTLFEIKGDGACYINDMLTQGDGNTINSVGNTSFVMGGYNDFHSGAYSGIIGYNNDITAFGNQTFLIGGSNKSSQVRSVLIGQSNQALYNGYNFALGHGIKMGGSDYQVALGINLNLTSSSIYGKGVFLGYNHTANQAQFGVVKPGTSTSWGNIGIGPGAATLDCAGAENSGNGVLYIGNYSNVLAEPTANAQDSVGLWTKRWNGNGTMGLVIKSEEGTRHFLGAASVIGGDYSDAIDGVKLLIKGNSQIDGQVYAPYNTLTDGATITPDFNDSNNMVVTLAGNRTMANPSNLKDGASYTVIVKQDATGSRTLSFGTAFKWAGGTAPTLSTGANAVDILTFISDGTDLYGSFVGDFQ
jgi:hypothetical protein